MKHSSIQTLFKLTSQISHSHTLLSCFPPLSSFFCVLFAEPWKGAVPQFLKLNEFLSKKRKGNEVPALMAEARKVAGAVEIVVGDVCIQWYCTWTLLVSLTQNFSAVILLVFKNAFIKMDVGMIYCRGFSQSLDKRRRKMRSQLMDFKADKVSGGAGDSGGGGGGDTRKVITETRAGKSA